jgi:hypothetical protein
VACVAAVNPEDGLNEPQRKAWHFSPEGRAKLSCAANVASLRARFPSFDAAGAPRQPSRPRYALPAHSSMTGPAARRSGTTLGCGFTTRSTCPASASKARRFSSR